MPDPLCLDLFTGLHGWGEGFIAEGYRVIGVDIVDMGELLGRERPAGITLLIRDVLTVHGAEFKDATCIVASPPCQKYSYMAMPWKRAKALAAWYREDVSRQVELNALFNACFRIQREASKAAGRYIPMVVENVRGAIPWVGPAKWHFGSYYLWGDVPALMPITLGRKVMKAGVTHRSDGATNFHGHEDGVKSPGTKLSEVGFNVRNAQRYREEQGKKQEKLPGCKGGWFGDYQAQKLAIEGIKQRGSGREWFAGEGKISRMFSSKSDSRKAASAEIAKIPFPLAQHIAKSFRYEAVKECVF